MGANLGIWLVLESAGGSEDPNVLLDFGALFGPFIAAGEYWRLFTAMFLHVGIMHLLFNSFGLIVFGRLVEQIYGHWRFMAIYLIAGFSGSISSYVFNDFIIGAGASGAIFGVLSALGAFFLAKRHVLGELGRQNLMGITIIGTINLVIGLITPGIDNWAHIGGLCGGFAIAFALMPRNHYMGAFTAPRLPYGITALIPQIRRIWILPALAMLLVAGIILGTLTLPENATSHIKSAERFLEQHKYSSALIELRRARDLAMETGDARALSKIADLLISTYSNQ